ncbi:NAD(P)-dependent oxidoreductase [Alkalibacterium sp.]|nr:MAG: NAD(P)-dependent oxidoreductase [Alkalibacterium sp.]
MTAIGFVGTGVMGQSIVRHLLQAGNRVYVYNRTKKKAEELLAEGANWCETPRDVAQEADLVFTMVGYPSDVEEVYYGKNGLFQTESKGKVFVDLTTSTPTLAEKIYETALTREAGSLDAPVSGGDLGAKKGTLTVMAGGSEEVFQQVKPIVALFSSDLKLHGGPGSGQHTKMANQIMVAGTMTGMTEMLVYAQTAGLDLEKVIHTLSGGAASNWSLLNYGPRILKEDYSPGFFVKHFVKDLKIALDEAKKMNLNLPSTQLAYKLYSDLSAESFEEHGTQALIKLWWND